MLPAGRACLIAGASQRNPRVTGGVGRGGAGERGGARDRGAGRRGGRVLRGNRRWRKGQDRGRRGWAGEGGALFSLGSQLQGAAEDQTCGCRVNAPGGSPLDKHSMDG